MDLFVSHFSVSEESFIDVDLGSGCLTAKAAPTKWRLGGWGLLVLRKRVKFLEGGCERFPGSHDRIVLFIIARHK